MHLNVGIAARFRHHYQAVNNDLLLYTSEGVDQNGLIQHGVIIQGFYLNSINTQYLADSTGAGFDLSQLLPTDQASYTENSLQNLALA